MVKILYVADHIHKKAKDYAKKERLQLQGVTEKAIESWLKEKIQKIKKGGGSNGGEGSGSQIYGST